MPNQPQQIRDTLYFGKRLREAMRRAGHISTRTASGVIPTPLAKATGVSYEMARRYLEGKAKPRSARIAQIAKFLNVPRAWLESGADTDGTPTDELDNNLLEECISAVIEAQHRLGTELPAEEAARIVAALYRSAVPPNPATVASLIEALR